MITIFDSLYAGHVDMDNVGYGGTAVNDRTFSDEYLATAFDKGVAIAQTLDRNGYDTFWMAEHHFQPEGYECIPNLIMLGLYLACNTERLKYGCGFNITPMWHPLRLAEDFAMADILSGGRIIFGVGRGYHSREVETFGSPMFDGDANRDMFEEQVEVMVKAFSQESFSHEGKHYKIPAEVPYRGYTLEKLSLVPRPMQDPVEIWQPLVSGNPKGVDFMARIGIKAMVANTPEPTRHDRLTMYQQAAAQYGRELELGEDIALGYRFFLGRNREEAIKEARPYFEEAMKFAAPLGLMALQPDQIEAVANPGLRRGVELPTLEGAVESGAWLCGSPDDIINTLKEDEARYPGVERINLGSVMGMPREVFKDQLARFSQDVMPAFNTN
jgi:alkanesulfonate monooxygenase SsuD/methylene tetrahydromethanopterin reductase-like flavin-dependent oxidoreductase (luciferase family)